MYNSLRIYKVVLSISLVVYGIAIYPFFERAYRIKFLQNVFFNGHSRFSEYTLPSAKESRFYQNISDYNSHSKTDAVLYSKFIHFVISISFRCVMQPFICYTSIFNLKRKENLLTEIIQCFAYLIPV